MSKHTPGPWTVSMGKAEESKDNTTWVLMAPSDDPAFAGTGEPVVVLSFASREDARLIAAAPELLEAANDGLAVLEGVDQALAPFRKQLDLEIGASGQFEIRALMAKIQSVTAKAEGKE